MKKLCSLLITIVLLVSSFSAFAYHDTLVEVYVNGKWVSFPCQPFIRDGVTYVELKTLSSHLGLSYVAYEGHSGVVVANSRVSACFTPGESYITIADVSGTSDEEFTYKELLAPCLSVGDHVVVPARDIATIFGYVLSYNKDTGIVYFGYSSDMVSSSTKDTVNNHSYYFQNQAEFKLPSFGSGYCWTCSYAMLITNVTGKRITPNDVAAVNISKCGRGAYCYHSDIVARFGVKFVSALPESSPYYGGRDSNSGGTFINNPTKDDSVARAAMKEALQLHPEGIMVRFKEFPHTMVAVAYEGDLILFNDPAPTSGSKYSDTGRYQGVPFSKTCIPSKGFKLGDVTFIQAIAVK